MVDDTDNNLLCRPFSETEVENALFQMEKIKPLYLIKCQLNFTRAIEKLLRMISCAFTMIFMMKK
jgi:hypothetical protein